MSGKKDFNQIIEACEADIRAGRVDLATQKLQRIIPLEVDPRFRQPLAALCRRTGLIHLGLKILTPKELTDREHWLKTVSVAEAAEYGTLVQRVGSVREAIQILSALDASACPDVYLFLAFCHLSRWESDRAVHYLELYSKSSLTDYKRLLARVNLASALSGTDQLPRALELIGEILREAGTNIRLKANCLEVAARVAIDQGDYSLAESYLAEADGLLNAHSTTDRFLIDKAKAIVAARRSKSPESLDSIIRSAQDRGDWESWRDTEFHKLRIRFDQSAFDRLYHGTPFPAYRERIGRELGASASSGGFSLGDGHGSHIDLSSGAVNGEVKFREGGRVHQILAVLFRDFYRPTTLGDLFAALYPDQHFDVFSSPERVYQGIRQTRKFLKEENLPLRVDQMSGAYTFKIDGSVRLDLPGAQSELDWFHIQWAQAALVPGQEYKPKELRARLGLGLSPFWKFANWAVENGKLERSGKGAGIKYRCSSKALNKAA
jgi:tetratricopeptide (TPR) repeat protein